MDPAPGWRTVDVDGLLVPVHESWQQAAPDRLLFVHQAARLDARRVADGELVDPARAREVEANLSPRGPAEVRLLTVHGWTAVKAVLRTPAATLLTYIVAARPVRDGAAVRFPEIHLVYALTGPWTGALGTIASLLHEDANRVASALRDHRLTREGHLAFWPILAPPEWKLVTDDGLRDLPASREPLRKVEMGGGWIRLAGEEGTPGIREGLEFRPVALQTALDRGGVEEHAATVGRELSAAGMKAGAPSSRPVKTRFTREPVWRLDLSAEIRGSSWRRVGYVWLDCLGYFWELQYLIPASNFAAREILFREMELPEAARS